MQEGEWRSGGDPCSLHPISVTGRNNYTAAAKEIRENFSQYFNSDVGRVSWQEKFI